LAEGAIGRLRHVQGVFSYFNVDPDNMRNQPELGGGALPDIGVYPTVVTRMVTGQEPLSVQASVEYDPAFGTEGDANVKARRDGVDQTFYVATQLAGRQTIVLHGDKGFLEVYAPFNTGKYGHGSIALFDAGHTHASEWSFSDAHPDQLQAES